MVTARDVLEGAGLTVMRDFEMPFTERVAALKVLTSARIHLAYPFPRRTWPSSIPAPLPEHLERFLDGETVTVRKAGAVTPLTDLEKGLVAKLTTARFPPYTASKRFVRDLEAGYIRGLSDRGRGFLAFVAHRFRRQYELSEAEKVWIANWLKPKETVMP